MNKRGMTWLAFAAWAVVPALAQWDSGSDGTDGNLDCEALVVLGCASACDVTPSCTAEIDLEQALTGAYTTPIPTPDMGRGIYDPVRWVVVYKYSSIIIPAGVTVTFKNHPSGAPVVWLAQGNVTINGIVNLDGKPGTTSGPIPSFAEGGPGGWAGGQRGHGGMVALRSVGHGPGGTDATGACPANGNFSVGLPASHLIRPNYSSVSPTNSKTYDNSLPFLSPLHGGSGGTAINTSSAGGGGGGGGAILIACGSSAGTEILTLGASAIIRANGGNGAGSGNGNGSGGGSGGVVRLRAPTLSVTLGAPGAQVTAISGVLGAACDIVTSPNGGIRIEYDTAPNGFPTVSPATSPGFTAANAASPLFPSAPPILRIVSIDGVGAPADPLAGILTTDLSIDNGGPVNVVIEGENLDPVPPFDPQLVQVRVTPARGTVIAASTTLTESGGMWSGTAQLSFLSGGVPGGRYEVQVRWPAPPP